MTSLESGINRNAFVQPTMTSATGWDESTYNGSRDIRNSYQPSETKPLGLSGCESRGAVSIITRLLVATLRETDGT